MKCIETNANITVMYKSDPLKKRKLWENNNKQDHDELPNTTRRFIKLKLNQSSTQMSFIHHRIVIDITIILSHKHSPLVYTIFEAKSQNNNSSGTQTLRKHKTNPNVFNTR